MDEKIKTMLEGEIKDQIENLSSLEIGSEKHSKAVDNLAKLYRLKLDEDKVLMESVEKSENRENEAEIRCAQLEESVKDRYIRLGIAMAELILPLMFYAVWMRRGFKFEENGTYTSTTFRGLFSRFRPTKK